MKTKKSKAKAIKWYNDLLENILLFHAGVIEKRHLVDAISEWQSKIDEDTYKSEYDSTLYFPQRGLR